MIKPLLITLTILITGCSANQPKPLINELTNAESLIQQCESEQGQKCYLAALTPAMVKYIQEAVKYYDEHHGESWL